MRPIIIWSLAFFSACCAQIDAACADEPAAQTVQSGSTRNSAHPTSTIPVPDPFHLTAGQEAELDGLLKDWENRQSHVQALSCRFTLFEYEQTFGDHQRSGEFDDESIDEAPPNADQDANQRNASQPIESGDN